MCPLCHTAPSGRRRKRSEARPVSSVSFCPTTPLFNHCVSRSRLKYALRKHLLQMKKNTDNFLLWLSRPRPREKTYFMAFK